MLLFVGPPSSCGLSAMGGDHRHWCRPVPTPASRAQRVNQLVLAKRVSPRGCSAMGGNGSELAARRACTMGGGYGRRGSFGNRRRSILFPSYIRFSRAVTFCSRRAQSLWPNVAWSNSPGRRRSQLPIRPSAICRSFRWCIHFDLAARSVSAKKLH